MERRRTPLHSSENGGLEWLGEAGVHRPRFLLFTFDSLKIVETAFAGDLALKLLETVEGHSGGIGSAENERGEEGRRGMYAYSYESKISPVWSR